MPFFLSTYVFFWSNLSTYVCFINFVVWVTGQSGLDRKQARPQQEIERERERERDDYNTLTKKWPNCTARPKKIFGIITYVHFDQHKNIIVHIFLYSRPIWIMHKKVKNRMEVLLLTKKKKNGSIVVWWSLPKSDPQLMKTTVRKAILERTQIAQHYLLYI